MKRPLVKTGIVADVFNDGVMLFQAKLRLALM